MSTLRFGITWDYRCPFARIAHDHVVTGLLGGADWEVAFVPFSLGQVHVEEGQPDVWDVPETDSGLFALQVGVVVRDRFPDRFPQVHHALFEARHVTGADLRDPEVLRGTLLAEGVDADTVLAEVATGAALGTIRREHEAAAADLDVWGVPTFIVGDRATFVRLMAGPGGDVAKAVGTVERIVGMMAGWPELNEFKDTTLAF